MTTVLDEYTTEEQCSVAFLWANGLDAKDIRKKVFPLYSGKFLPHKAFYNLVEKFSERHSIVADNASPGRPVQIATEATVQRVEMLTLADKRITTDSVATALGCSHGLAYSIMHNHLKFRKVCARWVPRELKDRGKMNRLGLSLQPLLR
jgi:transposase